MTRKVHRRERTLEMPAQTEKRERKRREDEEGEEEIFS